MSPEDLPLAALEAFANEQGIDLSDCESFYDKVDKVEEVIDSTDDLNRDQEVEFDLTVTIPIGLTMESLLWDGWWEYTQKDLTRDIADDGFGNRAEIQDIDFEHLW